MKPLAFALSLFLTAPALAQRADRSDQQQPSLPRTDPKTWSKYGWQSLKWGMGRGDVQKAAEIRDFRPLFDDGAPDDYEAVLAYPIHGMKIRVQFHFSSNRLNDITLFLAYEAPPETRAGFPPTTEESDLHEKERRKACKIWQEAVKNSLFHKYGPRKCEAKERGKWQPEDVPPDVMCEWVLPKQDLRVYFSGGDWGEGGGPCITYVSYTNNLEPDTKGANVQSEAAKL